MKTLLLLSLALFLGACTTQPTPLNLKKYSYNHKPYLQLKAKQARARGAYE